MEAAPSFTFDYVVIGGGTAGLALATLLSEDPAVTVAVLEAGKNQDDLDAVKIPGFMGQTQGKPEYDWGFSSTPQIKAGGRVLALYRGKMLGGTSAMNYMAWNRGNKVEQNDWEKLGIQGWDWTSLNTAVTAAERWSPPCHESETVYHGNNDHQNHGRRGYIKNTSHTFYYDLALPFFETMNANGVPTNLAHHSGNPLGVWTGVATIDPETRTRSYVTNAYYLPNKDRNNLVVITDAHVTRIILGDKDEQGLRTAQSVEYIHGEKTSIMHSTLEIIMCAGAIQSPQLLEVSGIGDAAVLDRIGVNPLIDLPSVGNNFQDHFSIVASAHLSGTHITGEDMANNPMFAREQFEAYHKSRSGILSSSMSQFAFLSAPNFIPEEELNKMVAIIDEFIASPSVKDSPIAKTFKIQRDWLLDENVAQVDVVLVPGLIPGTEGAAEDPSARHYGLAVILFHPWCRGSVHASTSSSLDPPTIDLAMLDSPSDIDSWIMVHALRFVFKCMSTGPLGATTEKIINPTPDKTNEELLEHVHQSAGSSWHFVGSTSMLPKDQGGVVDDKLKVYGTRNLRVVDAGVIPIQMGSNPQASIYGLAHRAAGFISDARMGVMV